MDNENSDKNINPITAPNAQEAHDTQEAQDVSTDSNEQVTQGSGFKVQTKGKRRTRQKETSISKTTQGKKGQKLPRINMAFSRENLEYLQIISRIENTSVTGYVNKLIAKDKSRRADEVEKAKSILKT